MTRKSKTVVIRASAGTGKTYQLTNRYLGLINDGVQPEHILAVTFTRLAAGEILERVLLRLSAAADDAQQCKVLAETLGDPEFNRERCLNLLQELTSNLHRMRIETLDAYFAQLAKSFSLEIGFPPSWEILEEVQDQRLRREALQQTIVDDSDKTVSRLLRVLFQGEARRNVNELLFDTVNQLYSVLLETDPSAWQKFPELKPLSSEALQQAISRLESATAPQHKTATRVKQEDVDIAKSHDWELFISKGIAATILKGKTIYYRKELSEELVDSYQELIAHARAVMVHQLKHQTVATFEILRRFDGHYQDLKQRHRGIRFDDVTHNLTGWSNSANAAEQNFRLDTEISHLLLDEFQDTSLRQWQIIRPLAERITAVDKMLFETGTSSFFCVGDVKQAIYGWRGGRSEIFDAIEQQLKGIEDLDLNESRRSAPPVIETLNRVFRGIRHHDHLDSVENVVQRWSDNFPEHKTALSEAKGFVQFSTAPLADWSNDRVPAAVQEQRTFEYAAQKVKELQELMPDRTIGILVRRNTTVARLIYELRKLGVKASEERGGNPLTDSAAVQVILSLLRLGDHPGDKIAAFHVATSPIGEDLGLDPELKSDKMQALSRSIRRSLMDAGYGATLAGWAEKLRPFSNARDRRRLQQLVELALRFEPLSSTRTTDFLSFVQSERVADPLISNVRVMNIHQSKGLEFDVVVLPELEAEIDSSTDLVVWDSPELADSIGRVCVYRNQKIQAVLPPEMQEMFQATKNRRAVESLCLLYVAMTRSAHALYMIVAPASSASRSRPRTFAGLLHVALAPEEPLDSGKVLFQRGDPEWHLSESADQSDAETRILLPQKMNLATSRSPDRLHFRSPSGLEGGNLVAASQLLQVSNRKALDRGTIIHGLFEEVVWIGQDFSDDELLVKASRLCKGHVDPRVQVVDFREMLAQVKIAGVLSPSYYLKPVDDYLKRAMPREFTAGSRRLEVHNERSFVVPDANTMLSGTIDRLVLIYDNNQLVAADIVDFKTDKIDFENETAIEQRAQHYEPQIEAYRRAVSFIFKLDLEKICGRLVFVDAGVVHGFSPTRAPATARTPSPA